MELGSNADNQTVPTRVARLETSVEILHQEIVRISAKLDRIGDSLASAKSINWGAVSVLVAMATLAGGLVAYVVHDVSNDLDSHENIPGHLPMLESMSAIRETVYGMDARLGLALQRVSALELHSNTMLTNRWTLQQGLENRERIAKLEAEVKNLERRDAPK